MAGQGKKKKSPAVLFLLAFAAIAILMFIANYRSVLVHELANPKGGAEKISTFGGQLIAISPGNEIYRWAWDNLSELPQVSVIKAQKVVAVGPDRLLRILPGSDNLLVTSNLKGDKESGRSSLGGDKECKLLQAGPNGRFAVAALAIDGLDRRIQLVLIDADLNSIQPVETKTMEQGLQLNDIGLSKDGTLIAAVGGGDKGWLFVADAKGKQLLWEMAVEDCNEFSKVVFSPDGRMLYASESGRRVYIFDITAKRLVKKLEMDKYKTPPNNPQTISSIAVSPDGRLLAAASSPNSRVWVWDAETGKKIVTIGTSQFSTCSMAFSPDSSFLAGAVSGYDPIEVWRISR